VIIPTIVTVEQAQAHLRLSTVQGGMEEFDLEMKIRAATQLVCEYIADRNPVDDAWIATIESWSVSGSPLVDPPPVVVAAVLYQVGELYRFRGDDVATDRPHKYQPGFLHPFVQALVQRYRSPVLA
jgi:hypothetical protein